MNILISNPSSTNITFLPYIYGVLKQYSDRDLDLRRTCKWLEPIFLRDEPAVLTSPYKLDEVDILGLSCYVWNFKLQCEIARRTKEQNPNCLVVAGGPEPDWNDPLFFNKHPELDLVVMQDGEEAFARILRAMLLPAEERAQTIAAIPGLLINDRGTCKRSPAPERMKELPVDSPYVDQPELKRLVEKYRDRVVLSAVFETNRGCPYKCVFCDWGSNVFSKIRMVPEERLTREIQWFGENKINRIYVTDANFGILDRDERIVDQVCETRTHFGWPKVFDVCVAKNHIDRVTRICLKLHDAHLMRGALVGLQSTNPETLSAMSRMNMSSDKHIEMLHKLNAHGATMFGTVIIGSPGDTLQTFQKTIGDLLEMGFHTVFRSFLYSLLPNAPASAPAYREKYGIKTRTRKMLDFVANKKLIKSEYYPTAEYIVAHKDLTEDEWARQCLFVAFVTSFHSLGPTRLLAHYFRRSHSVSYTEFYVKLFEHFQRQSGTISKSLQFLRSKIQRFLEEPDEHFYLDTEFETVLIEHERWLFLNLIENRQQTFAEIKSALRVLFPAGNADPILDELCLFQEFSIFPAKKADLIPDCFFEFDWNEYFSNSNLASPRRSGAFYNQNLPGDWFALEWLGDDKMPPRWQQYSRTVIKSFNYKDGTTLLTPQKADQQAQGLLA